MTKVKKVLLIFIVALVLLVMGFLVNVSAAVGPVIGTVNPSHNAYTSNTQPVLSAVLTAPFIGINVAASTIVLDGLHQPPITLNSPSWDAGSDTLSVTPVNPLIDDDYVMTITAVDNAGDSTQLVTYFTVGHDATAPTVGTIIPGNQALSNACTQITAILNDTGGSDISGSNSTITVTGATYGVIAGSTAWDAGSSTLTYTPGNLLQEDTYTVTVVAVDKAGNTSTPSTSTFKLDKMLPIIGTVNPVHMTYISNDRPTLSAVLTDAFTGIDIRSSISLVSNHNGVPALNSETWDEGTGTLSVTPVNPLVDDDYVMTITALDNAGNSTQLVTYFTVGHDSAAPTVGTVIPGNQALPNVLTEITAILNDTGGSGISGNNSIITVTGATYGAIAGSTTWNAGTSTLTYTPGNLLKEDNYTVTVLAADNAGNTSTPSNSSFKLDKTLPVIGAINPAHMSYLINDRPTLSAVLTDAFTGIDFARSTISLVANHNAAPALNAKTWDEGTSTLTVTPVNPLVDDDYVMTITALDNAGNSTQQVVYFTVGEDQTAPTWPDNSVLSYEINQAGGITLTWPSAADNVGVVSYRVYKNGVLFTTVRENVNQLNIMGLPDKTPFTFSVEAEDAAGNWTNTGLSNSLTITQSAVTKTIPSTVFSTVYTYQEAPYIHGDKMIWNDGRIREDGVGGGQVYWYDFTTGTEHSIANSSHPPAAGMEPGIYDNKLVWQDWRNGSGGIYLYDLETQQEVNLTAATRSGSGPFINGNKIVWTDYRNNNPDIYLYDLDLQAEIPIVVAPGAQRYPAIYGDKVVWDDNLNGNVDIYMYDLTTRTETRLTTDPDNQIEPKIYGNRVIWSDTAGIHVYDISLGRETQIIAGASAWCNNASIYQDRVVYIDDNDDPVIYNLVNGEKITIVSDTTNGANPQIYGNTIVWNNFANANCYIYLARIDTESPNWVNGRITPLNVEKQTLTLTWTPATDDVEVVNYRVYQNDILLKTVSGNVYSVNVSELIPGHQYTFRVEAGDAVGNWSTTGPTVIVKTANYESSNSSLEPATPSISGGELKLSDLTSTSSMVNGQQVDLVKVNESSVISTLNQSSTVNTVVIPVSQKSEVINAQVSSNLIQAIADKKGSLEVQTPKGSYILPATEIKLVELAQQLGVDAQDVKINIVIAEVKPEQAAVIKQEAIAKGLTEVAIPVEFKVEVTAGNKKREVNTFGSYVSRKIYLQKEVDQSYAVGVVQNLDGSISPVPTQFKSENGKIVAVIKRTTNSTYTVVENHKTFADVSNHWAKNDINLLASKLIISGVKQNTFAPEKKVTRAEFITLITRALGLPQSTAKLKFSDVQQTDWYAGAFASAIEAGIIKGCNDGTLKPNSFITKEETAAIVDRALSVAGEKISISEAETNRYLSQLRDGGETSIWARRAVAVAVKTGIINGDRNKSLAPTLYSSRAESMVIIRRLLQQVKFI